MSRPGVPSQTADVTTRPIQYVFMDFETPVYYSSRETVSWNGHTWLETDLDVSLGRNPVVRVFNENTTFGQLVLVDGTAGRAIEIYQSYWTGSAYATPLFMFSGEMGEATIGPTVTIQCHPRPPKNTPNQLVVPPVFNHLPAAGTRIVTTTQIIVLEGR